jgi:hypothetical protein
MFVEFLPAKKEGEDETESHVLACAAYQKTALIRRSRTSLNAAIISFNQASFNFPFFAF